MDEESKLLLNLEGQIDVARWTVKALESGHFNWELLCGQNEEANIAERWRLAHWLNEEKLLDEALSDCDLEGANDKETCAAIMMSFMFHNVGLIAESRGVSVEEVLSV